MNANLIDPFVDSTLELFGMMLGCELTPGQSHRKRNGVPTYEINGVIGMSGQAAGIVVVSLSRETAIRTTEAFLGELPDTVNADVLGTICELANMVAGGAKLRMKGMSVSIGLPSVLCGKDCTFEFPSGSTPFVIPFDSRLGPVSIEIGLVDETVASTTTSNCDNRCSPQQSR